MPTIDPKIQARITALETRHKALIKKHKSAYASAMQTTQKWFEREMLKIAHEINKANG
jgi:hypothetical protein